MTTSRTHAFAAAVMALGGSLIAITALALVTAQAVLATGIPGIVAKPQDVALLSDLLAVSPFLAAFGAFNLVAAIGLMLGRSWAVDVAAWVASVAVGVGLLALVLVVAGSGLPSAGGAGRAADADGLAIISLFVSLYAAAALAVRISAVPSFSFKTAPAAAG